MTAMLSRRIPTMRTTRIAALLCTAALILLGLGCTEVTHKKVPVSRIEGAFFVDAETVGVLFMEFDQYQSDNAWDSWYSENARQVLRTYRFSRDVTQVVDEITIPAGSRPFESLGISSNKETAFFGGFSESDVPELVFLDKNSLKVVKRIRVQDELISPQALSSGGKYATYLSGGVNEILDVEANEVVWESSRTFRVVYIYDNGSFLTIPNFVQNPPVILNSFASATRLDTLFNFPRPTTGVVTGDQKYILIGLNDSLSYGYHIPSLLSSNPVVDTLPIPFNVCDYDSSKGRYIVVERASVFIGDQTFHRELL